MVKEIIGMTAVSQVVGASQIRGLRQYVCLEEGKGVMGRSPGADRLVNCVIAEPGCWLEPCLSKASQLVGKDGDEGGTVTVRY